MIALVSIASEFRKVEDIVYPPLGLLYVGGALKKAGFQVKIYHIFSKEIDRTAAEISKTGADWVGFSVFTGLPCQRAAEMSRKLKALSPSMPVVWGGVHPSIAPAQCLGESYIDYIVVGEGEATVVELAAALREGRPVEEIKSVGFKRDGKPVVNERRPLIADLDECRMDWSLVDAGRYLRPDGAGRLGMIYVSSRGCPYNCGFCYNKKFHGGRWRAHSVDFVINDIKNLKERYGINLVTFSDDEVFVKAERTFEILEKLKLIGVECDWMEMRFEHVTPENLRRLSALRVRSIFLGWESGNDRILKLINKRFDTKFILEKCRILREFPEFTVDASGIIGFPTQTWEEILENVDFAVKIAEILPSVNFNMGTYVPYPGTELYELAVKEGFVPPDSTEDWGKYDIISGEFALTWLPWATIRHRNVMYLIDKYARYLDKAHYLDQKKDSFLQALVKKILYHSALWRMKHHFFMFPLDSRLEQWWTRRLIARRLYGSRAGKNPKSNYGE